jgi:hypothetical protein
MKIKVVKFQHDGGLKLFGLSALPERYRAHVEALVSEWAHVLDRFIPVSLNEVADRIRFIDTSIDAQVDSDLLKEYAEMAQEAFSSQGRVMYQLDAGFMP